MKSYSKKSGTVRTWGQGRYECLECNHKGQFKQSVTIYSRCGNCSSLYIEPIADIALVSSLDEHRALRVLEGGKNGKKV